MRAAILAVVAALPWMAHAGAPPPVTNPYPGIAAAYALTIDGRLTWADATDQRRQPASLAKLLTALVLLESPRWQPEAHVTVSAAAAGIEGSRIGLRQGEVLRAIDLLTGMLVRSGNDACLALVEHDAGSMPAFAERMNRHAAALGMRDSHFVHPCGLDARGQYTTVTDLLALAEAARQEPRILQRAGAQSGEIRTRAGRRVAFHNSNALIGREPDVIGLKSGFTSQAGNCVIALASAEGHTVVLVLLGAKDRWWEATGMIARAMGIAIGRPRLD
jgi:D-alanyl-D-alanine carboxypeptidase (penicillin-binding protein 5/6)